MANFDDYGDILEVKDAMELLKISRGPLYKLLRNGDIKAFQQGTSWRIPKQALINYIEERSGVSMP